jgi:hypothetical protein
LELLKVHEISGLDHSESGIESGIQCYFRLCADLAAGVDKQGGVMLQPIWPVDEAVNAIPAIGMTLVILTAGIDLSVGWKARRSL